MQLSILSHIILEGKARLQDWCHANIFRNSIYTLNDHESGILQTEVWVGASDQAWQNLTSVITRTHDLASDLLQVKAVNELSQTIINNHQPAKKHC